jgi:hypothetical protein
MADTFTERGAARQMVERALLPTRNLPTRAPVGG